MATEEIKTLEDFLQKHGTPSDLSPSLDAKKNIKRICCGVLLDEGSKAHHMTALSCLKTISRIKQDLDSLMDETLVELLLTNAGIRKGSPTPLGESEIPDARESQRCLNNFLLQSQVAQAICARNEALERLVNLIMNWKVINLPIDLLTANAKVFFLITALCPETRKIVYLDHRGVSRLNSFVDSLLSHARERDPSNLGAAAANPTGHLPVLRNDEVDLICEALRVLFNITLNVVEASMDEEEDSNMRAICDTLQTLFTINTESLDKKMALHLNSTNLIANIPMRLTHPLLFPLKKDFTNVEDVEYDGTCMNVPKAMLDLLIYRLDYQPETASLLENVGPVLSVLCSLSRFHRPVRKYLRAKVLPPLRDTVNRPEVGSEARNKLCKLLTSPVEAVSTAAAEFLFILCKESVSRLVKYTGYGNAAGLLARRGLMLGGRGSNANNYSEEEDSDTEEFLENAHKINPIVGCVEPVPLSPFEGMSEEQKEYEAMNLVNLLDKLQKTGIVKPAVPGPDGKPTAIAHMMQLQEAALIDRPFRESNPEEESD